MNNRERMICARVSEFRKKLGWSQREFAAQLGISLNQLASIEYSRTPLRYDIAWKLKLLFKVALEWLSVGELGPADQFADNLPPPESTGLPDYALLSEVSDKINGPVRQSDFKPKPQKTIRLDKEDQQHRAFIAFALKKQINSWISKVPQGYTADFSDKLFKLANQYLEALPRERDEIVGARLDALMWDEMRRDVRARLSKAIPEKKDNLTNRQTSENISDVKSLWQSLKRRLQSATNEAGKKSELANFLKVDLSLVSRWLGETKHAREPGAEYTLKMLHWVEQQERQK